MKFDRRLHGGQAEKLEEVVLYQVFKSAGVVKVSGPALQSKRLIPGDLDALYVVVVPERLEDTIGEAQAHDRRERLPGEKVVDAEHRRFGEKLV